MSLDLLRLIGMPLRYSAARRQEQANKELLSASDLFDADYYSNVYPDVANADIDPATHYLRFGGAEGRNPSANFDGQFYLNKHADLLGAKINPLIHYLKHGRIEGREIRKPASIAPKPVAPSDEDWDRLASIVRTEVHDPGITIIIPVYRGFSETANCLYKVLLSRVGAETNCEIVVIDDHSPEPLLSDLLNRLAARGLITLLRNEKNYGFVASVNRGMALHVKRDVILLNSDTEPFGDWVERLQRAAYSNADIGTVTPFSNNATICSYPNFPGEFNGSFEIPFEAIDSLAKRANEGLTVDIPTAVGFCMYIRRDCLQDAGLFDAKAFGRGYGEENDFCRRIVARGWRNVLAGDVFVRHLGRVSFLGETAELGRRALDVLLRRYPNYTEVVASYVNSDPPGFLRRNIDIARFRRAAGDRPFLFVVHNLGGGTLRHTKDLEAELSARGVGVFFLQPVSGKPGIAELSQSSVRNISVLNRVDLKHGISDFVQTVKDLGVAHVHVHNLAGFGPEAPQFVQTVTSRCGIRYDVTIHDYQSICPRLDMIDQSGRYCANFDVDVCEGCIQQLGSPFGKVSVWHWREIQSRLLAGARRVFVPDEDVKVRFAKHLPSIETVVRPHSERRPAECIFPVTRKAKDRLRVAVIGAIGPHKGSKILFECAQDARRRKLPISFVIFGFTNVSELASLPNVEVTGAYDPKELAPMLARKKCHVAFLPSVCPETYSYALSEAMFAGLYPVAFDLGAIAHRIRKSGWGSILPTDLIAQPASVNDALLSLSAGPMPADWPASAPIGVYNDILVDYYDLDLGPPQKSEVLRAS